MTKKKPEPFKTLSSSFVVMSRDTNHYGNVHGGVMAQYADNLAYALASQYSRLNVVTAKIHELNFTNPVKSGNMVILDAEIVRVGRTSLDIEVKIRGENLLTGNIFDVADAKFTMVAVDVRGKPKKIAKRH